MKLLDNTIIKIKIFFFLSFFLFIEVVFADDVYLTEYYKVDIITNDVQLTKNNEIRKIKKQTFLNIFDKILNDENKKKILKKIKFNDDLEGLIQNIIIDNEIITPNKYKASIKINIDRKELINFFRNYKISYTDIYSEPFLFVSIFSDEFNNFGLTKNNPFYGKKIKKNYDLNNYLIKIMIPKLNVNDRYIMPYYKIIETNLLSLSNISDKYEVNNIIILKIKKNNNTDYNISLKNYSKNNLMLNEITTFKIQNFNNLHNDIFNTVNEWWKNDNLINNKIINKLTCTILSKSFLDLNNIKKKISSLSQFKSIRIKSISNNKNVEEIEFYGNFRIFSKSLYLKEINIMNKDECFIKSIN